MTRTGISRLWDTAPVPYENDNPESRYKDPLTKEWSLEGGALVLADNGM